MCDENDESGEEERAGERVPRRVQDPRLPTREEIEQHNLTHLPFRSWCLHCLRGKGEANPHHQAERDDGAIPEVHMDYCFLGGKEETAQPVLVARDRDCKPLLSFLVKQKGAAYEYVVKRAIAFLKELGHVNNKIIIKTDQESPIRAVAEKIAESRGEGQTILEHSPVRSSGSNGIIERGIKEVEYQIRCMKSALDERLGISINAGSNILPWLIEYASVLLNRYMVGKDGKTAYERLKGKASKMLGFEFGETVNFRRMAPPGRLAKLDSLWRRGVFVGYRTVSGEYMVVNDEGVFKTRNIRRVPLEERWKKEAVDNIKFTPWHIKDPQEGGAATGESERHDPMVNISIDRDIMVREQVRHEEPIPRRVYLTKAILDKYGMTDGCPGCVATFLGGTGLAHNEECRIRIEKRMQEDPDQRDKVREVRKRMRDFVTKHMGGKSEDKDDEAQEKNTKAATSSGEAAGSGEAASSSSGKRSQGEAMASQEREKKKRLEEKEGEKRNRSEEGEEEDRGKAPMLDIAAKRKRDEDDEGDQDQRGEDIMEIMEVMCEDDVEDYKDAEM